MPVSIPAVIGLVSVQNNFIGLKKRNLYVVIKCTNSKLRYNPVSSSDSYYLHVVLEIATKVNVSLIISSVKCMIKHIPPVSD